MSAVPAEVVLFNPIENCSSREAEAGSAFEPGRPSAAGQVFGCRSSGGLCPRKVQLLGPPHTESGGFDPLAVFQVQSKHLGPQRSKAFHEVPCLFNPLVDAHFMEQFQQSSLRNRHPHSLWMTGQGFQTGLSRQGRVEWRACGVSGGKALGEPLRKAHVLLSEKGSVLDIVYSPPRFLRRNKRWFRLSRVPIVRCSAINPTIIVFSARRRAAKANFAESPLGPSFEISFLPPPQLQLRRDD